MSNNWAADIYTMHEKFGVHKWFDENKENKELMQKYLDFRLSMVKEEYDETVAAIQDGNAEEVVDGLIDLMVFALGTLDVMGVDANQAWNEVLAPNMNKTPGVKPGRPNPFGMPDLIKPEGWVGPDHTGNHGELPNIFQKK